MRLYPATPYEYAASAGGLLFTAGACPIDEHGNVVDSGLEAQAHAAIDNLGAVLTREGSSIDRIVKTTVYVATSDRSDLVRWLARRGRATRTGSTSQHAPGGVSPWLGRTAVRDRGRRPVGVGDVNLAIVPKP